MTGYDTYEARLFGFMSERLFNVWLERQNLKKVEIPVVFLEKIDWPKKIADFLNWLHSVIYSFHMPLFFFGQL